MGELIVRPAVVTDVPGMARVHVQSWRETYRGIESDEVLDDPGFVARRERFWTPALTLPLEAPAAIAVAEEDGEIVGLASAGRARDEDATWGVQLFVLYTLQRVHGRGAGGRLLQAVLGDAAASLMVEEKNPRARAFYRKHGFVEDGTRHEDGGFVELRMVRGLQQGADRGEGGAHEGAATSLEL